MRSVAQQFCLTSCRFSDPVRELPTPHLTSPVIAKAFPPTDDNFANYNWSIAHEALRHECMRLERAADAMSGSESSFESFREYFETYVVPFLERHHAVEDAVLAHHAIANKVSVPSTYADDHRALKGACTAVEMACRSKDLGLLRVAVRGFADFLRQHMADEEGSLLPKISAAFDVPWVNDLITYGAPSSPKAFMHRQSWSNTLQQAPAAASIRMAYEASKKWGAAHMYRSQLPESMQESLLAPQQQQFLRTKESLLVQACRA
jgi:hemerythrin-like domain-containing protein